MKDKTTTPSASSFQELIEATEGIEESTNTKVPETKDKVVSTSVATSKDVDSTVAEALDTTVSTLAPTVIERSILECAVSGMTIDQIVLKLTIAPSVIRTYLRNPKVKEYMKEVKEAINELDQMMLTSTLRKTLTARIDSIGDDEDYASLTNKDTLDIIKVFSDITNSIAKNKKEEKSDDVFVNIYQQIL